MIETEEIAKATKDVSRVKDWVRIKKTSFIFDKSKNLDFDHIKAKLTDFCNKNKTLPIRLSVYNYTNVGDHDLYGQVITSVREIEIGKTELELRSKRNKYMGTLNIDNFKVDMKPSLL